jgi:hypothetical protein
MSYENTGHQMTLVAAADLSAKQYYAVKIDSNGLAALAAAGEPAVGILQNKPTAGQSATIWTFGPRTKAVAGGTIAAGALVASDANGKLVTATTGKVNTSDAGAAADPLIASNVLGIAATAAVSGDVFTVVLCGLGAVQTTNA